jgi:hypothetical protein
MSTGIDDDTMLAVGGMPPPAFTLHHRQFQLRHSSLDDYDLTFDHFSEDNFAQPLRLATHRQTRLPYAVRVFCKIGLDAPSLAALYSKVNAWLLVHESPSILTIEDLVDGMSPYQPCKYLITPISTCFCSSTTI